MTDEPQTLDETIRAVLAVGGRTYRKLEDCTEAQRAAAYASSLEATAGNVQAAYEEQTRRATLLYGVTADDVVTLWRFAWWARHDADVAAWLDADSNNAHADRLAGVSGDDPEITAILATRPSQTRYSIDYQRRVSLPDRPSSNELPRDCPELGNSWEQNVGRFLHGRRERVVVRS